MRGVRRCMTWHEAWKWMCRCCRWARGVRAARATSAVELMGRKALHGDDQAADAAMTPADPAARILEALLAEPDRAARLALLPDAFTPLAPSDDALPVTHDMRRDGMVMPAFRFRGSKQGGA